jgi:protease-3
MKKILMISAVALAVLTGCAGERSVSADTQITQQKLQGQLLVSPNDQRAYKILTLPNKVEVILV